MSYSALFNLKREAAYPFAGEAGFGSHNSDLIDINKPHVSFTGFQALSKAKLAINYCLSKFFHLHKYSDDKLSF